MLDKTIRLGKMEMTGRLIMPPIATYKCDENGLVTDDVCAYYAERAANPHVSLIITEHACIAKRGIARKKQMSVMDDSCIPGLKKLVEAIHKGGALAICQLNHAGAAALAEATGARALAPSSLILPVNPAMGDPVEPEELEKAQIQEIVCQFAAAAKRAKEAGYDGVEIHSAHAYLLNEFYSPLTNKRTDEYGGSLENRLRIHKEVIHAVREAVGADYPIALRLGACDYMEGGNTVEDAVKAAVILEGEGIDLLDISGGMVRYTRPGHEEAGYFRDASTAIKKAVSIPVNLTGGIKTLAEAEALLSEGASDLVGVGRELLKNAKWEM